MHGRGHQAALSFSPDGRRVAYVGTAGEDWMYVATPKVLDLETQQVVDLLNDHREAGVFPGLWCEWLSWSPDASRLRYAAAHSIAHGLFSVDIEGRELRPVTPEDGAWFAGLALAAGRLPFARETTTEPPELFVTDLETWAPRRLTWLNPHWDELDAPDVRRIVYRSADDRWDIQALLVLPPEHCDGQRHPLIVEVAGGPIMVRTSFGGSIHFPVLAFASAGYTVAIPDTRGWGQGFPESFTRAIEHGRSAQVNPFSDPLAGVQHLVAEGIADPERLGICGHSYGGSVTALGITLTDRFAAAAVHDCPGDMLMVAFQRPGDLSLAALQHTMGDRDLPAAAHAAAALGIRYELVIYPRQHHVSEEPVMILDSNRRNLAWFDCWLRALPYPDAPTQARYEAWKASGR